jgi:hypothetical protein
MENILFKSAKIGEIDQKGQESIAWSYDAVASINFEVDGNKPMWLSVYQKNNMPGFYLSDVDIFDKLLKVRQNPNLMQFRILYFAGFKVDIYESIYPALYRFLESQYSMLIRLLCYMVREDIKVVSQFAAMNSGKYLCDIDIPTTDYEELYFKGGF